MTTIRRSLMIQVGEHPDGSLVAISAVVSAGDQSRSKAISGAVYKDDRAAWRAVRDFATQRLLEDAEQHVQRVAEPAVPEPVAGDAPF